MTRRREGQGVGAARGRGFRTRHLLHTPPGERAAHLLWVVGLVGGVGCAALNIIVHMLVYRAKYWVSSPETVACVIGTVVFMGVAVLGGLVRSLGGGR